MTKKIEPSWVRNENLEKELWSMPKWQLVNLRKAVTKVFKEKYRKSSESYYVPIDERVFTVPQLKMFFQAVANPVYLMLYRTMLFTGMRVGEAVDLKLDDLDPQNRCFRVFVEKKSMPVRLPKYFPTKFGAELARYINVNQKAIEDAGGSIFFNRFHGSHVKIKAASKKFRQTLQRTGLNDSYTTARDDKNPRIRRSRRLRFLTTNSFRKTHATMISTAFSGFDVSSRALHHANTDITRRHYLSTKEALLKVLDLAFDELL